MPSVSHESGKPVLVILHGWGHSKEMWKDAPSYLLDMPIIALDLPGFGSESLPAGSDWGIPQYAAWAKQKIESMNFAEVVLLGHSFGGRIAAEITEKQPQWLKSLILYGAPCLYRPSSAVRTKKNLAHLAKALGFGGRYRGNAELNDAKAKGQGTVFRRIVGYDQTEALKRITVPTLLVWGQDDADVPVRIAEEMKGLIVGSTLEVLPGLGHNAHLQNPNLFFGIIKKFISEL